MDALSLPGELDGAGDMIEQARGAPGLGFVLAFARDLTGEGDCAIGEATQAIAPGNRHIGAVVKPRVQIGSQRAFRAMTPDRTLERIQRHDIAGALPDRAEMRPRISKASPQTFRASRVARNFSVGVRIRNSAAASWLPASARSSASAVKKLIDSACSAAAN